MARKSPLSFRNWSIITKLSIALLVVSLIPMIIIVVINYRGSVNEVEATTYENLELLADSTAKQLDQLLFDTTTAAEQIAGNNEIVTMLTTPDENGNIFCATGAEESEVPADHPLCQSLNETLQNALEANPNYEYVYLMDRDGTTIISRQLEGLPSIQNRAFPDREYFAVPLNTGENFIDVLVGRSSLQIGFYFSSPVVHEEAGQEEIIGVAIIKVTGSAVTDIVNEFEVGDSGFAFMIDQEGVVVNHPDPEWRLKSLEPITDPETERSVAERFVIDGCVPDSESCSVQSLNVTTLGDTMIGTARLGNTNYAASGGAVHVVGYAPLETLDWVVGIDLLQEEFEQPFNDLLQTSILSVIIIGLIVIVFAIYLARGIARPLGKLASAAENVEHGRPFEPEDIAAISAQGDEVGKLSSVFSNMVVALRARMKDLETIYSVGTQISSSVEMESTLTYLVEVLREVIPYDGAEVNLYDQKANRMVTNIFTKQDTIETFDEENVHSYTISEDGFFQHMVNTGESVLIENLKQDTAITPSPNRRWLELEPLSYIGVPLKAKDQLIGVLEFVNKRAGQFTEPNVRVLESIAVQAAIAIQNAQEVAQREALLQEQIKSLKVEVDEARKSRHVEEITDNEFFRDLQARAQDMRRSAKERRGQSDEEPEQDVEPESDVEE